MGDQPLPTAVNGNRDTGGRFVKGNRAARGNPNNVKAQKLRNALLAAVSAKDVRTVVAKLLDQAKAGDVTAAKVLLDRLLGTPSQVDVVVRLEELERALTERMTDDEHS